MVALIRNPLLKRTLSLVILTACVLFIIRLLAEQGEALRSLIAFGPSLIAALLLLAAFWNLLVAFRYKVILEKCSGRKVPYIPWFRIFILGAFLNKFIPQAGNVYRSLALKNQFNISYTRYVTSYVASVWLDSLFVILLVYSIVLFVDSGLNVGGVPVRHVMPLLFFAFLAGPFAAFRISQFWRTGPSAAEGWQDKLHEFLEAIRNSVMDLRYLGFTACLALMICGASLVSMHICFRGLGGSPSISEISLFYVLGTLSGYVNITPGNLGVREMLYGVFSDVMGIGMGEGVLMSAILRVANYVFYIVLAFPFGGWALLRKERHQHRARDRREAQ